MKIAIVTTGPSLDAPVARKFGLCSHLLIVDTETLDFKAVAVPDIAAGRGSGLKVVALAFAEEAGAILVGYASPDIVRTLRRNDIDIVTDVGGLAREAVERHGRGQVEAAEVEDGGWTPGSALKKSARQFASVLPVLLGVVMLVGLFKTFASREVLMSLFSGEPLADTLLGAGLGSIMAGNPVGGYVMGDALLKMGVSLFAVTAILVTWVTVGLVQLPAEVAALGARFAIARTAAAFVVSIPIAVITALLVGLLA